MESGERRMRPLAEFLEGRRRVLVTSHVMPDGDSVGSSVALCRCLRSRGVDAAVVLPDHLPLRFDFLAQACPVHARPDVAADFLEGWDGAVVLDCSGLDRLGPLGEELRSRVGALAALDHHAGHVPFAEAAVVDPSAPSTASLVYELIRDELGNAIDAATAEALMAGLMADTGSFCYANATAGAFEMAADLVRRGAVPQALHRRMNERFSMRALDFMRECLGLVRVEGDGTVGWLSLPHEVFTRFDAAVDDASPLMRYVRGLHGVRLAVVLYEDEPSSVKVSFRSRGDIDVGLLARSLGGGGHRAAAGALLECSLEEAEARILPKVLAALTAREG